MSPSLKKILLVEPPPFLRMDNVAIEREFLGIRIDDNLSWKQHINDVR